MLARLRSVNVLPHNRSNWGHKMRNVEHRERHTVQSSRSTAFVIQIKDSVALVDGLPSTWPGLELGPLGTETKDQASDLNR